MSPLSLDDARGLPNHPLYDAGDEKVGEITDIYLDNDTRSPEWAVVRTGLFGTRESFVPLAEATLSGEGIRVPYTKDEIKNAPNAEPDGELSEDEEQRLYTHYGLPYSETASESGLPASGAGAEPDAALTRSEEQLRVGVQKRPSQTVRLRKHVVTEHVTQSVPVRRETLRVEREPITADDEELDGAQISEAEQEVVLHTERPVVTKETVPVERVRLAKDSVTEQVEVSEELRKERIDLDEDAAERLDSGR